MVRIFQTITGKFAIESSGLSVNFIKIVKKNKDER